MDTRLGRKVPFLVLPFLARLFSRSFVWVMGGGRKRGKNKKKVKGRAKVKQQKTPVLESEQNESDHPPSLETHDDLDALAAAIEATGTAAVKEMPKIKKKRKRNRQRKKSVDAAVADGAKELEVTYSKFKKEIVQEEITALKSIFHDNFVRLPDTDLPWQTGCPSFRIAQVWRV